jgi:uncharacterized membrane protein
MNREVTLPAGGQVRLSYNPPAEAAGHAVAAHFGSDPRRQMDEDLMRVKPLIETGDASHDAAENRSRTLGASAR